MHILYVSQYFPPEMGAPAARVHELAREWLRMGHRVTVLTGFPNHPNGHVPPEYRRLLRRGTICEQVDGIDVVRTWLYPAPNRFPMERILNYTSFFVSAAVRGTWLSRPDVVIGTSPQLLVGAAAWAVARRYRRPFVFEVRDLWPESLPASGVSRIGSPLYRALDALAGFLYRSADLIVPLTERFRQIIARRSPQAPMAVVENGVDTSLFRPLRDRDALKVKFGLMDRFVVSYIGTIGFAHGLHAVLKAAAELKTRRPEVLFLLVGEGAEREKLQAEASALGLDNVRFIGQRPRSEIPEYVTASDVCLVLLRRSELFETVLPSKMLEFMACSRPVLVGVGGLARSLTEESGGGIYLTPESHEELAHAVCRLRDDARLVTQLGANGYRFVRERFTRAAKASAYLNALQQVVN
jgi:colanic acid biosynthesis glycosyl transferase WcaI